MIGTENEFFSEDDMLKLVRNEIACIRIMLRLKKVTEKYNVILIQLSRLREVANTLGDIGVDIQRDAEKAERQCRDCIYRFDAVNESLKERDYRYINHQLLFATKQAKVFEEAAQRIHKDAQKLALNINQRRGGNEHDIRRVSQESKKGG